MWAWMACVISGDPHYSVWCEPGLVFLRCLHCGWRSHGWGLNRLGAER